MNKGVRQPIWLTERDLPFGRSGVRISVEVTKVLCDEHSKYGHIRVLETPFFGRILVIDGIIQTTESDEFIYHEMMVQLPGLQFGAPRKILIIGGGDGGALRQALRFPSLEWAVQVEIDDLVTRVSRQYLPDISSGAFDDSRVELVYADGAKYVKDCAGRFDVVVLDLTDPVPHGTSEQLFDAPFLSQVKSILAPRGVVMMQCGSLLFQPQEVKDQLQRLRQVFGHARLHSAVIPGYQLTLFGFAMASAQELELLDAAEFENRSSGIREANQYLTIDTYQASQVIPPYLRHQLGLG